MAPPMVNLDDLESRHIEAGHLNADWTFVGAAAGCLDAGMRRIRVRPGFSTPLHVHAHDEETFYVLGGSGLSVQDDKTYAVRPGDCLVHPEASAAHTLKAGDDGLDALAFGHSRERDRHLAATHWDDLVGALLVPDRRRAVAVRARGRTPAAQLGDPRAAGREWPTPSPAATRV